MMLWDIIRDFFVQFVFGGVTSNGEFYFGIVGSSVYLYPDGTLGDSWTANTQELIIPSPFYFDDSGYHQVYLGFADYLATTATIIVLIVLAIVVGLGIRWLFRFLISRFTKWGL